ncbi:MAG: PA14 domain-containing protein [Acidobacteriota bacterium]|nr:PA14 domain-containing protein [Acidobacteriota bacterium]
MWYILAVRSAALCFVVLFVVGAAAQEIPRDTSIPTFGTTVVLSSGLQGEIYFIRRNTDKFPKLKKRKPVGTIYTTQLNVPTRDFKEGFPGITNRYEWFAIDYTGKFWIEDAGVYRFSLMADDGAKLYIDDKLVIDNGGVHPVATVSGKIKLAVGIHRIRVPYFQGPRYQVALVLRVARPGEDEYKIFNTNDFKPSSKLDPWPQPR